MTFGKVEKRLRQSFEKEETLGKSHIQENRILQPVSGCRNADARNAPTRKFRNFSNSSNQYLEIQNPLYNSDSRHTQTFRSQYPGNSEIQIFTNSEIQNFRNSEFIKTTPDSDGLKPPQALTAKWKNSLASI